MKLFWVLLVAHFCGDVLFYSAHLSKAKRACTFLERFGAVARHCLIHASFILMVGWLSGIEVFYAAAFIFGIHFGIDLLRIQVEPLFFDSDKFIIIKNDR
jgi:hypothetical protein